MKFFIGICFFLVIALVSGNKNTGNNEGASTSSSSDEPTLTNNERCEIRQLVENGMALLTRELFERNNNGEINFEIDPNSESNTFRRYISVLIANSYTDQILPNHSQRRLFFITTAYDMVLSRVMELNIASCFLDHNSRFSYRDQMLKRLSTTEIYDLLITMLLRLGLSIEEITQHESTQKNGFSRGLPRNTRSVMTPSQGKCFPAIQFSNKRWDEFFIYLTTKFIKLLSENASSPKSNSWLCDYMRSYNEYYKHKQLSLEDDKCSNSTFSSFLYEKISRLQDWNDCMDFGGAKIPQDWCRAWRRLMLNTNIGYFYMFKNNKSPKKFDKDFTTVVDWLLKKALIKKPTNLKLKSEKKVESLICYQNSNSLSCPNQCKKKVARARRSLSSPEDIFYEREWINDVSNKLRCQCPEDKSTSVVKSSSSSGNWFSNLFGTVCDQGAPGHQSPRCDELRRKRHINYQLSWFT